MKPTSSRRTCSTPPGSATREPAISSPVSRRLAPPPPACPASWREIPIGAAVVGGSAASNPTAQFSLAGSNNGSNLHVARNLFTYEDHVSWTNGRHQITAGVWLQRMQSNEILALSQYGQATFTSLQTFLQGTVATLLYRPHADALRLAIVVWRVVCPGHHAAESASDFHPRIPRRIFHRMERSHGRASNYTYTNGVINTQPNVGSSVFTINNAKFLPQPRAGLAWSPFGTTRKTVLRAGFGMYNDLQDALGYRTDQNAPFNPTYSLPNVAVSSSPSRFAPLPATAKLVPGGVQPNL